MQNLGSSEALWWRKAVWVDTSEEELSLQKDLAISDGDNLSPDFVKCPKQLYMKMYVSLNDRKCGG